jgi:hypothetical protein
MYRNIDLDTQFLCLFCRKVGMEAAESHVLGHLYRFWFASYESSGV